MTEETATTNMIAGVVDHTYLKTEKEGTSLEEQRRQVESLVEEACRYGAYAVCVRESMVSFARELLNKGKGQVKLASVIGFPRGDDFSTAEKLKLLKQAREGGADEFDMVINYEALKRGELEAVYQDLLALSKEAGDSVLKVIFENVYLTQEEKRVACELTLHAFKEAGKGPRFFKTSTGFAKAPGKEIGATLEDVKLMYKEGQGLVGIKAAGGVRSKQEALDFFHAAGSPWLIPHQKIDPMRFRIGSSSLLKALFSEQKAGTAY